MFYKSLEADCGKKSLPIKTSGGFRKAVFDLVCLHGSKFVSLVNINKFFEENWDSPAAIKQLLHQAELNETR